MTATYRTTLYKALGIGTESDVPMDEGIAKTDVGARLLNLAESGDQEETAHMLALWETMRSRNENQDAEQEFLALYRSMDCKGKAICCQAMLDVMNGRELSLASARNALDCLGKSA